METDLQQNVSTELLNTARQNRGLIEKALVDGKIPLDQQEAYQRHLDFLDKYITELDPPKLTPEPTTNGFHHEPEVRALETDTIAVKRPPAPKSDDYSYHYPPAETFFRFNPAPELPEPERVTRSTTTPLERTVIETTQDPDLLPFQVTMLKENIGILENTIYDLTDSTQRRVLTFHFLDGKPLKEVAEDLGKTEGLVRIAQHRGLNNLRKAIKFISTPPKRARERRVKEEQIDLDDDLLELSEGKEYEVGISSDPMPLFLKDISAFPLLTPEQEVDFGMQREKAEGLREKAKSNLAEAESLEIDLTGFKESKDLIKPFKDRNQKVLILPFKL